MTRSVGSLASFAKSGLDRWTLRRANVSGADRWVAAPSFSEDPALNAEYQERLRRDRKVVVPWLAGLRPIEGARILEVGCGEGASSLALAEQGAVLTVVDISHDFVTGTIERCATAGYEVTGVRANADQLEGSVKSEDVGWVVYWAVLEHMTVGERVQSLRQAWAMLPPGGLLSVIETPNRLWFFDSHTSDLPFFMWLPDELAFEFSASSTRPGFGGRYQERTDAEMLHFQRRGRGVSFHEFEVAIGPAADLDVVGCLQLDRRRRSIARHLGWRATRAGRFAAMLKAVAPSVPEAFLQPFLYVTIRKP